MKMIKKELIERLQTANLLPDDEVIGIQIIANNVTITCPYYDFNPISGNLRVYLDQNL